MLTFVVCCCSLLCVVLVCVVSSLLFGVRCVLLVVCFVFWIACCAVCLVWWELFVVYRLFVVCILQCVRCLLSLVVCGVLLFVRWVSVLGRWSLVVVCKSCSLLVVRRFSHVGCFHVVVTFCFGVWRWLLVVCWLVNCVLKLIFDGGVYCTLLFVVYILLVVDS